jgi:AraC-like DNA-binding protein
MVPDHDIGLGVGSLPRVLFAHAGRHAPGAVLPENRHSHWVLDCIRSGRMRWRRNGVDQPLLAGHAYLYRPGDVAGGRVEGSAPLQFFGVVFSWDHLDGGADAGEIAPVTPLPEDERAEVEAAGAAIVEWFLGGRPGWESAAGGRLAAVLGLLAALRRSPSPMASRDPHERRLARAAAFIRANLSRPFRIGEAAAAAGLSETHFRDSFARRFGASPLQYAIDLRLLELRRLLAREPGLRIGAACARAGFSDPRHAGRLFKRRFGATPEDWRRSLPKGWWERE